MRGDEHPTRMDTALAGIDLAQVIKSLRKVAKSAGSVRVDGYYPLMGIVEQLEKIQNDKFRIDSPHNRVLDSDLPPDKK